MKKQEIQAQAYATYAAIGELTLKQKQLHQQEAQIVTQLQNLENKIVSLSKELEACELEEVANVD